MHVGVHKSNSTTTPNLLTQQSWCVLNANVYIRASVHTVCSRFRSIPPLICYLHLSTGRLAAGHHGPHLQYVPSSNLVASSSPSIVEHKVGEVKGTSVNVTTSPSLRVTRGALSRLCRLHKWLPVNWDNMEESIAVYQHKSGRVMLERVIDIDPN